MSFTSPYKKQNQMDYFEKQQCSLSNFIAMFSNVVDCNDIYKKGWKANGVYGIKLPDKNQYESILCEMSLLGGGWTVIQQRVDGSVDFNKTWKEYRQRFGELSGDFWYGLDRIHNLTKTPGNEILIPFEVENEGKYYPMYDEFMVADEDDNYRMTLGALQNVLGTKFTKTGLERQSNMQFSTFDRDNDVSTTHCGKTYSCGWWFAKCYSVLLNGRYMGKKLAAIVSDQVTWYKVDGKSYQKNIIKVRMLVRRKNL